MTMDTSSRDVNAVAGATEGHDATSLLLWDALRDMTHRAELQTPMDTLLTNANKQTL